MHDEPDTRRHARWIPALGGLLFLIVLVPSSLDDATRDTNVQCVSALGKGECTVRLGWLLHSYEWTISAAELQGTSFECSERRLFHSGCYGSLDLLTGSEDLGQIDRNTFAEFSDAVDAFANGGGSGDLDVSLGPPRAALVSLFGILVVGLGFLASFEYSELDVDEETRMLRLSTRGLLQWADQEIPLEDIARVTVEHLPVRRDRDEPNAIVWVQRHSGEALRVGRSGEASAEALAGWIRDRIARQRTGQA